MIRRLALGVVVVGLLLTAILPSRVSAQLMPGRISASQIVIGTVALARGGTGASLSDPNADRILFWDDSAGASEWLTVGSGLSLSGTTLTATATGDVVGPASSTDNAIARFDSTTGKLIQNSTVTVSDAGGITTADGTEAAPALRVSSEVTGWYLRNTASYTMVVAGSNRFEGRTTGFHLGDNPLTWGTAVNAAVDTRLDRTAANAVKVWNGTTFGTVDAGILRTEGANTQRTVIQQATTSLTCNSGTGTCTATNLIPAGSLVIGVDARVTTILAGTGLTTWALGDGTDTDRWALGKALAAGTTVTLADTTITSVPLYAAATNVVLTAAAGQFDSGVVRLTVHYITITAAGS